ncbi:hypothetical protein ACTFIW_005469 [Dictyostelium discoideum]
MSNPIPFSIPEVQKPGTTLHRPVIDFKKVKLLHQRLIIQDGITERDHHSSTPVVSLLNQCKDSKLFSKTKYTSFITHIGKFEYSIMPQGLVNSPSTFARLMAEIFKN